MIVRILLAAFGSLVAGVSYGAGLLRLMSALLVCFGAIGAIFFGVLFLLPPGSPQVTFTVAGPGESWPFFAVSVGLLAIAAWILLKKARPAATEVCSERHWRRLGYGLLLYLGSLLLPVLFWFPSEQMQRSLDVGAIELLVCAGVVVYLGGSAVALTFLYRASRGATEQRPDLMRRLVLIVFSACHLDKLPLLVAYLLVYSEEPALVFPRMAALALTGYFLIALFLARLCSEARVSGT